MFNLFKKSYLKEVQKEYDRLLSAGTLAHDDEPPFTMQKGEHFICTLPVKLGTYKNNGNFGYSALTARIKIAKGIYARAGAGKMGMQKSWVFDHPGELHFTTKRIIFNGDYSNVSTTWSKILDIEICDKRDMLYLDRDSGKDMAFEVKQWPEARSMASVALMKNGGQVKGMVA